MTAAPRIPPPSRRAGFPIGTDPLYFHPAWGPALGKGGLTADELTEVDRRFQANHAPDRVFVDERSALVSAPAAADVGSPHDDVPPLHNVHRDPLPHELVLWLHAARYAGPEWAFEAPLPAWTDPAFDGDRWLLEPDACARMQSKLAELAYDDVQDFEEGPSGA